ncbi:cysteine desulfurase family protein [Calidifontibacillus erzurumensis]|uniref:Cysteine desulfurase n=1 Tax=Calidifontibacillus erzurumensis TaxID=2741433 RepID=A0A8J8KB60_9BACI|nr:cysteine desulfurase family protein [Calidifontibacillus erzurumensis]NSL51307.1 cysteine desulfurase [Calidifontibacillus erzurumensis]
MIYFDNSATTKPYKEVVEAYLKVSEKYFGNPSSLHSLGSEAEKLLSQSRILASSLLGVKPSEVIFTSGGTEGNNAAIKGVAIEYRNRGKHLITSAVEHPSVLEAFKQLESLGYDVTYLDVDKKGRISIEQLKNSLRDDTILVSLIHVNNELGAIQPIIEVGQLLKKYPKILFHVDHVQGITKVPLSLKNSGIDLCTISGHKFHALKGTGLLYIREGIKLAPLLSGGGQEMSIRSGTENTPGIVAMTKALRLAFEKANSGGIEHLWQLKERLSEGLKKIDGVIINTPEEKEKAAPHIINFSVLNMKPEVLIQDLSKHHIYVSSQSACSSKLSKPSRVLMACGLGEERAKSAIRVSFSYDNTIEEVDQFLDILTNSISNLQKVMG